MCSGVRYTYFLETTTIKSFASRQIFNYNGKGKEMFLKGQIF
jgi:hypothetical protein